MYCRFSVESLYGKGNCQGFLNLKMHVIFLIQYFWWCQHRYHEDYRKIKNISSSRAQIRTRIIPNTDTFYSKCRHNISSSRASVNWKMSEIYFSGCCLCKQHWDYYPSLKYFCWSKYWITGYVAEDKWLEL